MNGRRYGVPCAGAALFLFCLFVCPATPRAGAAPALRLSCFSVDLLAPEAGKKLEDYPNCDALCAAKGAVCAGTQNGGLSPPVTCATHTSNVWAVCRCCAVEGER